MLQLPGSTLLLISTVLISLYTFQNQALWNRWMLHPYSLIRQNKWYQIFTSGFIHADYAHLGMNMFSLLVFAQYVERDLGLISFLLLYFFAMVMADIPSVIKHKNDSNYYSLGASGAVSGLVFAFILLHPTAKLSLLFLPIRIPGALFGLLYLGFSIYAERKAKDNVNHLAHIVGGLAGIVFCVLVKPSSLLNFVESVRYLLS